MGRDSDSLLERGYANHVAGSGAPHRWPPKRARHCAMSRGKRRRDREEEKEATAVERCTKWGCNQTPFVDGHASPRNTQCGKAICENQASTYFLKVASPLNTNALLGIHSSRTNMGLFIFKYGRPRAATFLCVIIASLFEILRPPVKRPHPPENWRGGG